MSVLRARILLVLDVERLLGVSLGFLLVEWGQRPVLIYDTFEAQSGLLAHVTIEACDDLMENKRGFKNFQN